MPDPEVTQLSTAFPTNQPNAAGSSSGTATETPLGATKANPLGIEAPAIAARQNANRALEGVTKEEGENLIDRGVMGQENAEATSGIAGENLDELHRFHDAYQKTLGEELAKGKELRDRVEKGANFHDYWADHGAGNAAIAAIASGLLGFGGHPANVAKDLADADHQKQVDQLNALMKTAEMQGADTDRLMKIHEDASGNLSLMQELKYKKLAAEFAKQGAMAGTVEAKTAAQKGEAYFLKLAAEEKLKYDMSRRVKASKTASQTIKTPTAAGGPAF